MLKMPIEFEKSFASYWRSWWWSSINCERPENIAKFSNKKAWFICTECNHEFNATISNISNGQWCSYCKGDKLCADNDCTYCFNRSFASCDKSKYWSILNDVKPRFVLKGGKKSYVFDCNICNHEFSIIINRIVNENAWCPYCVNSLCNDNECDICYNNSFASNPLSKYWSKNNELSPRLVRKSSGKKYIFNCNICNHEFSSALNNIKKGTWCPYCCTNSRILCIDNNCMQCFNKSFASNELSKYWSDKNTITPRQTLRGSIKKYLFNCNKCDREFSCAPLSVQYGRWCPYCKNKTEQKLYAWLIERYTDIGYQIKYNWCINPITNRYLPYDFEYNNIIIELDGPQHYRQISNWRSPEEQLKIDKYKMQCALNNNKHLIRIAQWIVLNDSEDWENKLSKSINEIKLYNIPSIHYIGIDPDYFN